MCPAYQGKDEPCCDNCAEGKPCGGCGEEPVTPPRHFYNEVSSPSWLRTGVTQTRGGDLAGGVGHNRGVFGAHEISDAQRDLHIATEAIGVGIAAPFLWWASEQTDDEAARAGLKALAAGTAVVDGALLANWLMKKDGY